MMNKGLIFIGAFSLGAAVGVAVSWKLLKTKYEQIAQEEIDSVQEVYFGKKIASDSDPVETESVDDAMNEEDKQEYENILKSNKYIPYSSPDKITEEKEVADVDKPYVISPDEFDELGEYDTTSLIYYTDKILADTDGNVISDDDIEKMIGHDSLTHFGEYEDDSVFVRNDERKTDYEILLDPNPYATSADIE